MIEGVDIKLNGKDYTVPPLNFKAIRVLRDDIEALSQIKSTLTDEQVEKIINIIHMALVRNYPEITRDELEEIIDLGNFKEIIKAIMGISGVGKKKAEQETAPL